MGYGMGRQEFKIICHTDEDVENLQRQIWNTRRKNQNDFIDIQIIVLDNSERTQKMKFGVIVNKQYKTVRS